MNGQLTPGEQVEAGRALADVRNWAGVAWRRLGNAPSATCAGVLADLDEITKRLEEVRALLGDAEFPSATRPPSGTGWV